MSRVSTLIQTALLVAAVAFIAVQVLMFYKGTACTEEVVKLQKGQEKLIAANRALKSNNSVMAGDLRDMREQLVSMEAKYHKASAKLEEFEAEVERQAARQKDGSKSKASWEGLGLHAEGEVKAGANDDSHRTIGDQTPEAEVAKPQQRAKPSRGKSTKPKPTKAATNGSSLTAGKKSHTATLVIDVDSRPPPEIIAAVVVMACNRADYLERTVRSILSVHEGSAAKFPLFISQDGEDDAVQRLAKKFPIFTYMQHIESKPPVVERKGEIVAYYRIANHYKWALNKLFVDLNFTRVIILEDDMEIASDFFDYFEATSALLDVDESIMAVSSWNDNGQQRFVHDPELLYRSDFFPGLGWMLKKQLWLELEPKWPKAYWDDWLRLSANRRGRQVIRPEICRTFNFGKEGSSRGQFYEEFLASIRLNNASVPWYSKDLSYLLGELYDGSFKAEVAKATRIKSVDEVTDSDWPLEGDVALPYRNQHDFEEIAKKFAIFQEWKDGVPRTAYQGVVTFRFKGPHHVFLASSEFLSRLDRHL